MKRTHLLGALLVLGCTHEAPPPAMPPAATSAAWDAAAADEARATIERDMQSFGKMDVEAMRQMLASDGFVTTYDIDGMGQPVSFASGDEALNFLAGLFEQMKKAGAQVQFTPSGPIDCRATSVVAYCAFAADVQATIGGKTEAMAQRTTAVMTKGADGWKWAHWHASLAKLPEAPAAPPPAPAPTWPMSFYTSGELKWEAPPGAPPGLRVATIAGDPTKGAFSAMVEFPKKLSIPRHYHSANGWGYLVKGDMTVTLSDGRVLAAKPGSTFMLPAKAIHTTETKTGATIFQYSDGPEDIVFVDDKGNPSAPPAQK